MPYTGPEPARRPLSSDDITDGIVSTADLADSAVTTAKITNNAVTAAKVSSDVSQLGKNLIINGAMTVAARGTQTGQGDTGAYTAVDRYVWRVEGSTQGRVTTSQDTDVPSGKDFGFSLKVDCTTAESAVAADEAIVLQQRIEAQNLQHLRYGDASAKTVMVSFWVKSPKNGTHCVGLYSQDGNRHYVKEYTVGAADTWEYKTVTFPGDASGTINNDTGRGLDISWPLVAGGNHQVTADTWASGEDWATSNQQNLLDNTANNFYITGVQLEVGSVATDFEHEDISITQFKCDRFYQRYDFPTNGKHIGIGWCNAVRESKWIKWLRAPMRSENGKSISVSAVGHFSHYDWDGSTGGIGLNDTVAIQDQHQQQVTLLFRHSGGGSYTVGEGMEQRTTTNNAWMAFEDEL